MRALQAMQIRRDPAVREVRAPTPLGAAGWLHFAATPTFVLMALVTGPFGQPAIGMPCSAPSGMPAVDGMVLMYGLMAVFHAGPWIALLARRRRTDRTRARR